MTDLTDSVLTLVDVAEGVHFMRTLEATFCGIVLDRELRSTARDITAGALDEAGTEVCFACQTRWFDGQGDAALGRYATRTDTDIPKGDVDPASFLAGYLAPEVARVADIECAFCTDRAVRTLESGRVKFHVCMAHVERAHRKLFPDLFPPVEGEDA